MACGMMTKVARNVMSAPEVIRPDLPQPTKAGIEEQFILASGGSALSLRHIQASQIDSGQKRQTSANDSI